MEHHCGPNSLSTLSLGKYGAQTKGPSPLTLLSFVLPFKNVFPYLEGCFSSQLSSGEKPFSVSWLSSRCNLPCAPQVLMLMRELAKAHCV